MKTAFLYRNKPKKCRFCSSLRIATISYGYPCMDEEMERRLQAGTLSLGGCVIGIDDPAWECSDCKIQMWRRKRERLESSKKPSECLRCGSDRIATILHGTPPEDEPELLELLTEGEFVVSMFYWGPFGPRWQCQNCLSEMWKKYSVR